MPKRDTSFVVVCPVLSWESTPMGERDAYDLLESPLSLHPFEGSCRTSHYVGSYEVDG